MEIKKAPRMDLLRRILSPLVSEWGADAVRTTVTHLETLGDARGGAEDLNRSSRDRQKRQKPSAVSIAERAILSGDRKASIILLARKFDRKEFLRSAGDIRHFFEMNSEIAPKLKRREDAFRKILMILVEMPPDKINQLAKNDVRGGPARLGPLSDAMRGVGAERSERKPIDANKPPDESRTTGEVPRVEEGSVRKHDSE